MTWCHGMNGTGSNPSPCAWDFALLLLAGIAWRRADLVDQQRHLVHRSCRRRRRPGKSASPYIVEPFAKRGELDQGILRFTWYSLVLVAKGYAIAHC